MTPDSAIKTVRVRILVAVDEAGKWTSAGYAGDTDAKDWIMLDDLGETIAYRWVEADVPLPEVDITVEGTCQPDATI